MECLQRLWEECGVPLASSGYGYGIAIALCSQSFKTYFNYIGLCGILLTGHTVPVFQRIVPVEDTS